MSQEKSTRYVLLGATMGKCPEVDQGLAWLDLDLTWSRLSVEPTELSSIVENIEMGRVLLGLLPMWSYSEGERVWK